MTAWLRNPTYRILYNRIQYNVTSIYVRTIQQHKTLYLYNVGQLVQCTNIHAWNQSLLDVT